MNKAVNDRLGAWGKALKRLFLCSHSITRLFAMKIITPEKINFKIFS